MSAPIVTASSRTISHCLLVQPLPVTPLPEPAGVLSTSVQVRPNAVTKSPLEAGEFIELADYTAYLARIGDGGPVCFETGRRLEPGEPVVLWHDRVTGYRRAGLDWPTSRGKVFWLSVPAALELADRKRQRWQIMAAVYEASKRRIETAAKSAVCNGCSRQIISADEHWRSWVFRDACSPACTAGRNNARRRKRRAQRRGTVTCDCGTQFTPKRADARYCSAACKQRIYRKRAGQ